MADTNPNVVGKADKTERSSAHNTSESSKKSKGPAKKASRDNSNEAKKSTQSIMEKRPTQSGEPENIQSKLSASEDMMLTALNNIQSTMKQQSEALNSFSKRLDSIENYEDEYDVEQDCDYEFAEPETETQDSIRRAEVEPSDSNNNRFKDMAKRFKATEKCDKEVDGVLAENINNLFLNGIEEERYTELTKDENNARPENCEGLTVVKMNQLIWDAVSPSARTADKKLQNIESSIVKSATLLTKVVDNMAKIETSDGNNDFGSLIDNCNDALALLGHANKQVNLSRKDFLRPELKQEYSHLCSQSRPYTKLLFGDDVSKSAKEIEDCSKISFKMFQNKVFRGPIRRGFGRGRFRGNYSARFRGRGRGLSEASTSTQYDPKNYRGRGSRGTYRH